MHDLRVVMLTDVVDSTQLTDRIGDAASATLWREHDRLARDLLPRWRGREIDKSDGMLLLFENVPDAVGFAREYHEGLAGLTFPVTSRVGLHLGPVLLRENSAADVALGAKRLEVDGLAKPLAARVMSMAPGGHTLLTREAMEALTAEAPGLHRNLESCGHWAFKGIAEPVEVFALDAGIERPCRPAENDKAFRVVQQNERWLPVRETPNNLPVPPTSFVGRQRELADLKERLRDARLITLLGMGGLGKTRLSLQVAHETRHLHPDGSWFIDLSPLRDPGLVATQTARVLGVREEPHRPIVETLCEALRSSRTLLVFDNCEHLLNAAGDLVDEILRAAPNVRVLASSREPLDVPGEQSYPIQPLPLPDRSLPEAAVQSPAVRLFVDRARAHRPDFDPSDRHAPQLVELVIRLEGIPLAIELAAARIRDLDLADILAGLEERYRLLTGGSRRLQGRQQTLRALVDWSYDLLSEDERATLRPLGVFIGGFDLSAAQAVCSAESADADRVRKHLKSLTDKSLLVPNPCADGERWGMLETIREYAADQLAESGRMSEVRQRHNAHFFAWAKQARNGLEEGSDQALWLGRLETERDNLRAAIAAALEGDADPFIAIKMAVALQGFWILRGYATEGRTVVDAALKLPPVLQSELAQAHALQVGAALADSQGDHAQALHMLRACLALRRQAGEPVEVAATLATLATAQRLAGDPAGAADAASEALRLFEQEDDPVGIAIAMQQLGLCHLASGDRTQAKRDLEQVLTAAESLGHAELQAECEIQLAELDLDDGSAAAARPRLERALSLAHAGADRRNEALARLGLARLELRVGDASACRHSLEPALQAFQGFEMRDELLAGLELGAQLAQAEGRAEDAMAMALVVDETRRRGWLVRATGAEAHWKQWCSELRSGLSDAALAAATRQSRVWTVNDAVERAVSASGSASASGG